MEDAFDRARDGEAIARRVLRPSRGGLDAVRAAIAELTDPREAWETLAVRGLIADEWFESDARRFRAGPPVLEEPMGYVRGDHDEGSQVFVWKLEDTIRYRPSRTLKLSRAFRAAEPLRSGDFVVQCGRFDIRAAERPPWSPFPPTMDSVVGIAADVNNAASVEALAREHFGDASHVVHWRALGDEELERMREDAIEHALSAATPKELRAVLALGYFVPGLDNDRAIEIVCPERVELDSLE